MAGRPYPAVRSGYGTDTLPARVRQVGRLRLASIAVNAAILSYQRTVHAIL